MQLAVLLIAMLPFIGGDSSQKPPFPQQITIDARQLVLNGYGTREAWWVSMYRVGLYLPRQSSDLDYIRQEDVAKSIWVTVTYGGSIPENIPQNWQQELFPALEKSAQQQLKSAYERLSEGDRIRIQYLPSEGTTLFLNDRKILSGKHQLMQQFLDIWLGPKPVSENLKRLLLN